MGIFRRPAVQPVLDRELAAAVERLEERSYTTYLARLKARDRLNLRNNAWNASLISLATSTTIASVGLLVDREMYGSGGEALLVSLAILSLVASLVVSSMNYGARSRAMEANYKRIQQISLSAESFFVNPAAPTRQRLLELSNEYGISLENSENHSNSDYLRSKGAPWYRVWRDSLVNFAPLVTLAIPAILIVPFAKWFFDGL